MGLFCIFSLFLMLLVVSQDVWEAPHPTPSCDGQAPLRTSYYFNNGTGKCEREIGCSNGTTDFSSEGDCKRACPYGIYASND
ncbi:secreted protein, putative [Ixodes scapularis]|uniref:Secreted protein, putative n=1 Tax=Ixodes scapularis TaxID=6945 RepID=B7QJU5_IXOSC|nr:secreted protein, putative [Ixodes scapularis]|eukprot:XP_002415452.1 secreted protein, putative [Ixodes scapularis]